MASYDAQINILVAGQRNINNLLGQLNEIEGAIAQIESKWKVASAALQRADIRLGATGRQQPRGEGGRFASDPDRRARAAALADRRRAAVEQRLARMGLSTASAQEASIRNQIEGNDRLLRQTERRISLESQLNTAVERLERRQSAYARGGGGSKLSEELQDRVRNIQTTFQAVGGANVRNLSLVRSLATELGSIVELQNEVNRGTRLQSRGFYKAQGLERNIASLRERGLPPSAFATVGGQMRDYRSAIQKGNQPEAETIAKRIKENLDRLARDLDQSFAELKKSQSVRLAARSWQTFFEDAASQALQIKQSAQNTKESWQVFFKDAANQALAIKQAGQDTKQGWKNFFEDATNQALSIKQNGQETKQAWKSFFEDAANQALAIKQAGQDTKQSWKNFFEDATSQALAIKQNGQETKQSWQTFFEDAANSALQVKGASAETRVSWQTFFEDAANQALAIKQNGQETKNAWKSFFEDAANQALAIKQNGQETKQAWRSFFEDATNQALAIKQNAQETKSAWRNFFEDAANQALAIRQNGQETKQAWKFFFEDAASQALEVKQNAQETKNVWKSFFEDASGSALQIKQNNAEARSSWRSFFEEASSQALSIKQNAQETKNAWKSFFEDAANQALNIKQNAQEARQAWKSFFEDAANQALAIKQGAVETKNVWKLFFEDAASQALQVKQNAKETKNSWQVFFEDAAGEANRLRSPMLQAKQSWQQFFIDAAEEAATARRKPVGAMTPEQRVAGGILDPASLRQQRLGQVARGRKGQAAIVRAGSEGLIGGAFPLLFGQGAGASAGGFTGGVLGGLAGGGLGFGLSLLGTVLGTAVDEADRLDKELGKVNASVKGVGNTSADVNKLASSLGIAKEEAISLLAQFKQFGSAQIRKDLALVFGGDRGAILERLESIVKEEDVLQAIAAARKEIGNQEAISLLNTFKIQGSAQAQLVLREALLRISEKEVIEEKKRITLLDRVRAIAAGAAPAGAGIEAPLVDPAIFGKERAKEQQKAFDKERDQRRKNYDTAIKESQELFKELDALSPSGKGSKDASASNLLSAIDAKNEAIDNARKQREQQIADIRKQAIEAAARIEEDLADKRKQIEREIQDVRRSRADSAIDADIRFRELRGEDPGLIEAERELLAISREDRDARIELQRRLGDEEEAQAKVIAEFEKGVAKQIQDANLAGARAIGEIQSNYAKQVAKIVEEGSTKGAKRLEIAAKLYALYMERGTLQQGRIVGGAQAIPEPVMRNNQLDYQEVPKDVVTPRFRELDQKIYDLQKQLQSSRRPDIGQQFTALLGAEGGYEDIAGLQPLPLQKMLQQIGRPYTELYKQIQRDITGLYAIGRREAMKVLKPDPARTQTVLQRAEKVEEVRQTWKPLEAQSRELLNRTNPAPRSQPSQASLPTFDKVVRGVSDGLFERLNKMHAPIYGILGDISDYLNEGEREVLKKGIAEQLRQGVQPSQMPVGGNINTGRAHLTTAVRELTQELVGNSRNIPRAPAPSALPQSTRQLLLPLGDDSEWRKRFMEQTEPIQITPGVQSLFEGASLPGGAFDVSKVATDFGTIVAASILRGVLKAPEISEAFGSDQVAQVAKIPVSDFVNAPSTVPRSKWPGAAATTEARENLGTETLGMLDDKKFASLRNYFASMNEDGIKIIKNFEKQGKQLDAQLSLMRDGLEPSLAQQLVLQEETYSLAVEELQGRRQLALEAGHNATAVEEFYKTELELLKTNNIEIKRRTVEYARQSEYLLAMASLNQQLAVTGMAEQAGFFGAGASAFTSELSRSGDIGQATDLAELTRLLEAKQAIADIRGELNSLADPINVAITAADGIGVAFAQSFQGLIDGSMSAREALGSFFKSVGDMFLEMAAQIIAKQMTMIILQTILKALGAVGGDPVKPGGDWMSAVGRMSPNANGNAFGANGIMPFASGGAFTNSIVRSPTLFKFADGGTTRTGLMGEAGPEAIMPLKRGADGSLGVQASGLRSAMGRPPGGATTTPVLNMSFQSTTINGVEYVSRDQLEAAMAETRRQAAKEGASRGMDMTLDKIQNSPSTRSRVGIR